MSDIRGTGHPEPTVSGKVHFWMGGAVPTTLSAWAREQIRSRWFPLRRLTGPVVIIAFNTGLAALSDRSVVRSLQAGGVVLAVVLVGVFVFRDRLRDRDIRRYQT